MWPASVRVRSVGGGELWDDYIDLIPELSHNDTIGGVLSGRDIRHRAIAGVDYVKVDKTLDFVVRLSYYTASELNEGCGLDVICRL